MGKIGFALVAMLAAGSASAQAPPIQKVPVPWPPDDRRIIVIPAPPRAIGSIEFLEEAGIERYRVNLAGGTISGKDLHLRFTGIACTHMGEITPGMITPLYENMTFLTSSGKECKITAIERKD